MHEDGCIYKWLEAEKVEYLGQRVVPVGIDQGGPQVRIIGVHRGSLTGLLDSQGQKCKHFLNNFTQWIILRPDQYINFQS